MGKIKYQIFISSTYTDLKRERSAVTDTIIHMGHFPVGMESFGASSRDQWDIIKEMMDESDYIVLIIGYRYGTEIKDGEFAGISYTEREFQYAKEHKIPVLAFIEERRNVPESRKESDPLRMEKLEKFKSDVMYHRTVDFWSSTPNLREKVQVSLNKEYERTKRPGWVRAEHQSSEDTSNCYDIVDELEFMREAMTVLKPMKESGLSEQVAVVNGNVPFFTAGDYKIEAFEVYSDLDSLGRCGVAFANICPERMPIQSHENSNRMAPTGWDGDLYIVVNGGYLYRYPLIGSQLARENVGEKNLMIGTRHLKIKGMLPLENMVHDYIEETENHVLYRVTPIFEGNRLLASGVLMEGWSVEDFGDDICFCVYCYNV